MTARSEGGTAHTNGRGSKQALVRDEILGMLDELQVGDALPSERRLASDLGSPGRRCAP